MPGSWTSSASRSCTICGSASCSCGSHSPFACSDSRIKRSSPFLVAVIDRAMMSPSERSCGVNSGPARRSNRTVIDLEDLAASVIDAQVASRTTVEPLLAAACAGIDPSSLFGTCTVRISLPSRRSAAVSRPSTSAASCNAADSARAFRWIVGERRRATVVTIPPSLVRCCAAASSCHRPATRSVRSGAADLPIGIRVRSLATDATRVTMSNADVICRLPDRRANRIAGTVCFAEEE
jgi:hypothetical protein